MPDDTNKSSKSESAPPPKPSAPAEKPAQQEAPEHVHLSEGRKGMVVMPQQAAPNIDPVAHMDGAPASPAQQAPAAPASDAPAPSDSGSSSSDE